MQAAGRSMHIASHSSQIAGCRFSSCVWARIERSWLVHGVKRTPNFDANGVCPLLPGERHCCLLRLPPFNHGSFKLLGRPTHDRLTDGRVFYRANRKACCEANSVHAIDLSSWFKVEASVASVDAVEARVSLRLLFWDVGHGTPRWKALRWGDLGEMHGRRVHASVVSFDMQAAWHVHPPDSTDAAATELTVTLGLPPPRAGDESAL